MPRLIDANELESHFHETKMIEIFPYWKELSFKTQSELIRFGKALKEMMQNAPTVDAVEVVHGSWLDTNHMIPSVACSVCGGLVRAEYTHESIHRRTYKYCPYCGASMR